jgi:hypothetical protein
MIKLNKRLSGNISYVAQNLLTKFKVIGCFIYFLVMPIAAQEYAADTTKLDNKATKSKDLYIEPSFNFLTYKEVTLDFSVNDTQGNPMQGMVLKVFSVLPSTESGPEQPLTQKSLISIVRTDNSGRAYRQIEMSNSTTTVLVELGMQTANNTVTMDMHDSLHISHAFEIE